MWCLGLLVIPISTIATVWCCLLLARNVVGYKLVDGEHVLGACKPEWLLRLASLIGFFALVAGWFLLTAWAICSALPDSN